MQRFKHPATVIAFIALFVSLTGGAIAAKLITGKDIKNGSIKSKDIKNGTIQGKDIKKSTIGEKRLTAGVRGKLNNGGGNGAQGPQGPKGDAGPTGPQGPKGDPGSNNATFQNPNWGTIFRNTIGSPGITLAGGPNVTGATPAASNRPPFGVGSLQIAVDGVPNVATGNADKAAFGNQVDFAGADFNGLSQLGFHVFTTGENSSRGNPNMPTIQMEIDPNLGSTTSNFSTLTFQPANSTPGNQWSGYLDATTAPANSSGIGFFLSGAAATATNCTNGTPCTFTQIKNALADVADPAPATVLSVSVVKGRDFSFQGAIDGLRVAGLGKGDQTFDFEPFGTNVITN